MSVAHYIDRDTVVEGLKLHYQEWGDPAAPPILMIHGFGVSGHMFDEFADRMQATHRLIALDQRGHGDSDWAPTGDYSRSAFVGDIEAFRQSLGIEDFILVGHSMGGLNSVSYTVEHPEHVRALVLVDVGPEAAKEGVENIVRFTRGPDELDFEQFVEMAHRFNQRRTIENIRERMRHRLRQLDNGKWTWKFDERFRKGDKELQIGSELNNDQMWQLFRSVKPPTLLIRGGESDVLSQEVAERCVREMSNARLVVIPGAGHSVPGDMPEEFTAAVQVFIEDVNRGKFGPEIEASVPPLGVLVRANDRAARRRPGSFALIVAGVGAAAAVTTIVIATKQAKRRRARVSTEDGDDTAEFVEEMDDVSRRGMFRAAQLVRGSKRAPARVVPAAPQQQQRARSGGRGRGTLRAVKIAWKVATFGPKLLLAARRAQARPKTKGRLPWRS